MGATEAGTEAELRPREKTEETPSRARWRAQTCDLETWGVKARGSVVQGCAQPHSPK